MSLKANINVDATGNIIIHMDGDLNYDNTLELEQELQDLAMEKRNCTITLDLHKVDFVGSSGISRFVNTLNQIQETHPALRLINVRQEFLGVFKLYNLKNLGQILDEFESDETSVLNQVWGNRNRTFEN